MYFRSLVDFYNLCELVEELPLFFHWLSGFLIFFFNFAEYISQRQPLGGLLFLLPQMFSFEDKDGGKSAHQDHETEPIKNVLAEVEQLLVHSNIPVSEIDVPY